MNTQESIKIFCYAQHWSSRNGGIVPVREVENWFDENPEKEEEAGEFCDDWNLVAEGTREEIKADLESQIANLELAKFNSNVAFDLRQLRNALEVVS